MLQGIFLTLLIGAEQTTIPKSAPANVVNSLKSVEITNRDDGPDGFQLLFSIGRSGSAGRSDFPLSNDPLLKPNNRVIIQIALGPSSDVLIDGIITNLQFSPTNDPGKSTLTITGEDIGIVMDKENKPVLYPNQSDETIARNIINKYSKYGFTAVVKAPPHSHTYLEKDITPAQHLTDRQHLTTLAKKYNFVFYVEPTPKPGELNAYWGPLNLKGNPQKALTFNMGPYTNVTQPMNFQYNPMAPILVKGSIQDRQTNQRIPIETNSSSVTPLSKEPTFQTKQFNSIARHMQYRSEGTLTAEQAKTQAQSQTDNSMEVVTASGELDTLRYGDILLARKLVDVRGVGFGYDGSYYVKSVTHAIKRGDYKQKFELKREGLGAKKQVVNI
jgi:hypothetical protein